MSDQKGRGHSTASKDAGVTSTRPIGSVDPAMQVPLPGSSGTSLASQAAAKSPPPSTPGANIGAGGPPSHPFDPAHAFQQAQSRQGSQQEAMDVATPQGAGESVLQSPLSLGSQAGAHGPPPPVPAPSQSEWIRLIVSSYEANRVLTPTVPKQQWRPVSENELAYTAASAQCWVHA